MWYIRTFTSGWHARAYEVFQAFGKYKLLKHAFSILEVLKRQWV